MDKVVCGTRICESTRTSSLEEAEKYLARKIGQLREARVYGVRPTRLFRQAAAKYLLASQNKAGIDNEARYLQQLDSYIGHLPLEQIHDGTLETFVSDRLTKVKKKTVNLALGTVRHILNLAAHKWKDKNGLTWLLVSPKITMLTVDDAREPYPLLWDEQEKLFSELPVHLRRMAVFKVNTGCREQEVCRLQWKWEIFVPELNTSVFLIPGHLVKNRDERLVVLNKFAKAVIEEFKGIHPEFIFIYPEHPVTVINNTAC